jgi:hypothetical protein
MDNHKEKICNLAQILNNYPPHFKMFSIKYHTLHDFTAAIETGVLQDSNIF